MTSQEREKAKTHRPASVWIALVILILYIPLLTFGFFVPFERSVLDEMDLVDEMIGHAQSAAVIASLVVAFFATFKRKRWGRWFLLAPLFYIVGSLGFQEIFYPEPTLYDAEDRDALWLGFTVGLAPMLLTFVLVSVGDSVREYFEA